MTEDINEQEKVSGIHIFGMVISSLPSLMLRLAGTFLKFKKEAKKGGRAFQKELIARGLDAETAAKLTGIYLESSNLMQYMRYAKSPFKK